MEVFNVVQLSLVTRSTRCTELVFTDYLTVRRCVEKHAAARTQARSSCSATAALGSRRSIPSRWRRTYNPRVNRRILNSTGGSDDQAAAHGA